MGQPDLRSRVGEHRGHAERDEDAPLDPRGVGDLAVPAGPLLVEDPPDDEDAGPEPGCGDHAAVAARDVERLALGAREEQDEHGRRDQQHRGLHEREGAPPGQRAARRPQAGDAVGEHRLLIPGQEEGEEQTHAGQRGQPPLLGQLAPDAKEPGGGRGLPVRAAGAALRAHTGAPAAAAGRRDIGAAVFSDGPVEIQLRGTARLYGASRAAPGRPAARVTRYRIGMSCDLGGSGTGPDRSAPDTSRSGRATPAGPPGSPRRAAAGDRAGSGRARPRTVPAAGRRRGAGMRRGRGRRPPAASRPGESWRRAGSPGIAAAVAGLAGLAAAPSVTRCAASASSRSAAREARSSRSSRRPSASSSALARGRAAAVVGVTARHRT